jgi:chromosome segregation ATPase
VVAAPAGAASGDGGAEASELRGRLAAAESALAQREAELFEAQRAQGELATEHNDLLEYLAELNEQAQTLQARVAELEGATPGGDAM